MSVDITSSWFIVYFSMTTYQIIEKSLFTRRTRKAPGLAVVYRKLFINIEVNLIYQYWHLINTHSFRV